MIQPHSDAVVASAHAVSRFEDDAWEDLLNFIEEKQVIPIVGPVAAYTPSKLVDLPAERELLRRIMRFSLPFSLPSAFSLRPIA